MQLYKKLLTIDDLAKFADGVTEFIPAPYTKKQEILETLDVKERVMKILQTMDEEMEILAIRQEIQEKLQDCVNKHQREYVLREQMKVIKKELGEDDNTEKAADEYMERLQNLTAPEEVKEKLTKEISRLRALPPMAAESGILTNYIETLLDYPWGKSSKENDNLEKAIKILERDHYGLEEVKERIIDYLAVHILNEKGNMPILCLVGPPGTGKTSIARSIATATGKEYVRMSLGGVRDEAEIRGHRRTYIGAMPGRIAQSIAKTKTENPLVLLDEIDKAQADAVAVAVGGENKRILLGVIREEAGIRTFGPKKNAAILEGSKAFSKDLMKKYNIPTAAYENFTDPTAAVAYLETAKFPIVLKADGLALGKGVLICKDLEEAKAGVKEIMLDKKFGTAGNEMVIEEFMTGREVSVLSFVDGKTIKTMTSAQAEMPSGKPRATFSSS